MTFTDYAAGTTHTARYPGAETGGPAVLPYLALGLAGEASEVLDKEEADPIRSGTDGLAAELGDVAWYLARLHLELDLTTGHLLAVAPHPAASGCASTELIKAAGRVAELVKKALRDDAGALTDTRRRQLTEALTATMAAWLGVCAHFDLDPAAVLAGNRAKLDDRHARGVLAGSGDTR